MINEVKSEQNKLDSNVNNTDEAKTILKGMIPALVLFSLLLLVSVILTDNNQYITIIVVNFIFLFIEYILATHGHVTIASYLLSLTPAMIILYSYTNLVDFNDEISLFFAFWLPIFFSALSLPFVHYIISLSLTLLIMIYTLQVVEKFTIEIYVYNYDFLFIFSLAVVFATALSFGRHLMARSLLIEINKMQKANKALLQKTKKIEKARTKAEAASKNKSIFLASVSHELRTPLNGIINFSKFVKNGKYGDVVSQHSHMINRIYESGHELLKLINNVLDISKIASGSFMLFYEDDIRIEEVFDGFDQIHNFKFKNTKGQAIEDANISFSINYNNETYALLQVDTGRLRQALFEILTLCFYYTTSGSVCMNISQADNNLIIYIEDSCGSALDNIRSELFDLPKLSNDEIIFHIGLGLSIAKEIIELHGGHIIYSYNLKGNIFQISLPIIKEQLIKEQLIKEQP